MSRLDTIGRRIDYYLFVSGRKQVQIANDLKTSRATISKILRGDQLSGPVFDGICKEMGCTAEWLRSGVGAPPEWAADYDEKPHESAQSKDGPDTLIPIAGQVTCGDGWVHESQDPDDHAPVVIRAHWRAVRIQGHSAEPIVLPGQCVLVDDRLPVKDGRIVCVQTKDGRAYCKRYCKTDGHVVLAGLNAGIDSVALHADEIEDVSVVVGTIYTDSVAR